MSCQHGYFGYCQHCAELDVLLRARVRNEEIADQKAEIERLKAKIQRVHSDEAEIERLRAELAKQQALTDAALQCGESAQKRANKISAELARAKDCAQIIGTELHAFQEATGCDTADQVAAALRERLKAERERCAKVCESLWNLTHDPRARMHANKCASAIRAMGDAE